MCQDSQLAMHDIVVTAQMACIAVCYNHMLDGHIVRTGSQVACDEAISLIETSIKILKIGLIFVQ